MSRDYTREALGRFAEFRESLAKQEQADPFLRHADFKISRNSNDFIFGSMADDFTREIISSINKFYLYIFDADCWIRVANEFEENERSWFLYEFAEPFLELALNRPYSLRNRFIFCNTHLLHQSNKLVVKEWKDKLPRDRDINYKTLERIGAKWARFPEFMAALNTLDNNDFRQQTKNYRHLSHHRFPAHIDRGLLSHFSRVENDHSKTPSDFADAGLIHFTMTDRDSFVSYEYRLTEPLKLDDLLKSLYWQHRVARKVFDLSWSLLNEQLSKWSEAEIAKRPNSRS
jgi:hypothetical protein